MDERQSPNPRLEAIAVLAVTAGVVLAMFVPYGVVIGLCAILGFVRWLNYRHDPRRERPPQD
jgi:hypothetical protein